MVYEIRQANEVRLRDYVRAFNEAYRDYYTPIAINEISLRSLIHRDAIDLSSSIAVLDEDKIVGLSMMAVRPPYGWIGGVGVIPPYRRQGIARRMMDHLLGCARQQQLQYISLEVIDQNVGAFDLYRQFGFETTRRLVMMDRPLQPTEDISHEAFLVIACEAHEALVFYDQFHEIRNAWQRSRHALMDLSDNLRGWLIVHIDCPEHVLGYVVGWLTDRDIHILDMAGDPLEEAQDEFLRILLQNLHHHEPNATGHAFNVGDNDVMYSVLRSMGYEEILVQYEMQLRL